MAHLCVAAISDRGSAKPNDDCHAGADVEICRPQQEISPFADDPTASSRAPASVLDSGTVCHSVPHRLQSLPVGEGVNALEDLRGIERLGNVVISTCF